MKRNIRKIWNHVAIQEWRHRCDETHFRVWRQQTVDQRRHTDSEQAALGPGLSYFFRITYRDQIIDRDPHVSNCFQKNLNRRKTKILFVFREDFVRFSFSLMVFVDLKSNSALLFNKGHNFWKNPQNWIFPY